MKNYKDYVCCICGKRCNDYGCNPDGAAWYNKDGGIDSPKFKLTDKCCKECDNKFVTPGRVYRNLPSFGMKMLNRKEDV